MMLLFLLFNLITSVYNVYSNKTELIIYAMEPMSGQNAISGEQIVSGEKLAIDYINNSSDILPNYTLILQVEDSAAVSHALLVALGIVGVSDSCEDLLDNNNTIPVVLGLAYSSLSTIVNTALSAYSWAQISAAATSIQLSDKSTYTTFYRTVPSDEIQAKGLIRLCSEFEWTNIGIIYVSDSYGIYLSISLLNLARLNNITASAIGYNNGENDTISSAAEQLKALNVFVTILIVHAGDITNMLLALDKEGILGYPYYYLGCDTWLDGAVITALNISDKVQGFIGTIPWKPGALNSTYYEVNEDIYYIYNQSEAVYEYFTSVWDSTYNTTPSYIFNLSVPGTITYYGWESIQTLARILHLIDQKQNLTDIFTGNMTNAQFLSYFEEIIVNEISYYGVTGNVSIDSDGDRNQGLYSFAVVTSGGETDHFGYIYYADDNVSMHLFTEKIIWPTDFELKDMEPRTEAKISTQMSYINRGAFITMTIFNVLSILLALFYATVTYYYRKEKIIAAASWRLNICMCGGCIIAYVSQILYGLDEREFSKSQLNVVCNIRIWLFMIAFTIGFTPLFMKTYRISKIFTDLLVEKKITDQRLLLGIGLIVGIDIFLLTILTASDPRYRVYSNGSLDIIDPLQYTQHIYGTCWSDHASFSVYIYYSLLGIWKTFELSWGAYLVSIVCRVGIKQVSKFDETGPILVAIIFGVIVVVTMGPLVFILRIDDSEGVTIRYLVIAISTLIVYNLALGSNVLPRLIALYRGKKHLYEESPEEKIRRLMEEKLLKLGIDSKAMASIRDQSKKSRKNISSKGYGSKNSNQEDKRPSNLDEFDSKFASRLPTDIDDINIDNYNNNITLRSPMDQTQDLSITQLNVNAHMSSPIEDTIETSGIKSIKLNVVKETK